VGCVPRVRPATGSVVRRAIPATSLPAGHRLTVFTWELTDQDMFTRGEGAVRSASPDSARLDFFLSGGLGSGSAVLIGANLEVAPGAERIKGLLMPTAPMLWAVTGRAAPPAMPDTTLRVDADTLRVDIGKPLSWRFTFVRDSLRRVERISGTRVVEWVARFADGRVRYRNESSRRQLDIAVTKVEKTRLDATVWTLQ
jgi:hypothetical protein